MMITVASLVTLRMLDSGSAECMLFTWVFFVVLSVVVLEISNANLNYCDTTSDPHAGRKNSCSLLVLRHSCTIQLIPFFPTGTLANFSTARTCRRKAVVSIIA